MSSKKRLFIEASNIHIGGGYILLLQILDSLRHEQSAVTVFLDARLDGIQKLYPSFTIRFVAPTFCGRLKHYLILPTIPKSNDKILCFGNIPPFKKPACSYSVLYLQNWFLICDRSDVKFENLRIFIRIMVERLLLKLFSKNVDTVLVQTETVRSQAQSRLPKSNIVTMPFHAAPNVSVKSDSDFYFYPARGDKSKNHVNLINCWIKLSKKEIRPKLVITIDVLAFPNLCSWIDEMVTKHHLNIKNIGFVDISEIHSMYSLSPVIIFPSYFESYGLPLVEAHALGLNIIAPELDYVRDVCVPVETFDPHSTRSIERAILRYLRFDEPIKTWSASDVLTSIMENSFDKKR